MIRRLLHTVRKRLAPTALVLMYHRVAELEPDIWRLAVSPRKFEQHLQLLCRKYRVVPLTDLVEALLNNRLRHKSIALSFDDGYADNFLYAKPLLEKYKVPATFFVSSGSIGRSSEFWWDELERVFLHSDRLPPTFDRQLGSVRVALELGPEQSLSGSIQQQHRAWKAYLQPPPTRRATLFLRVWEALRPLPQPAQQECLQQIRGWAGVAYAGPRPLCHSMSLEQLQALAGSKLVCLGAHTVSHPDLAAHSAAVQRQEMLENKLFLESIAQKQVRLLAYPYGSYTPDTMAVAAETGFTAAFTTDSKPLKPGAAPYRLGRFLVDNWSGVELDRQLKAVAAMVRAPW